MDIVAAARALYAEIWPTTGAYKAAIKELADEIERLRAENANLRGNLPPRPSSQHAHVATGDSQ